MKNVIGIIAPAAQIENTDDFSVGLSILKQMGFLTKFPRDLWPGYGYLADTDAKRAEEFNRIWADPEVDALLCVRGGFGSLRMLADIDLDLIKRQPKLLVGFSDITILLNYIYQQTGITTLHGPVLNSLGMSTKASLDRFYHCLTGKHNKEITISDIEILRSSDDEISATLVGGNLSSIMTLMGTAYELDWTDKIVFLEDVGEPLYKLDRKLTQLHLAGKLAQPTAIILGDFSTNKEMDSLEKIRHHEFIWNRVLELTRKTPVYGNFQTGHGVDNLTIPIGEVGRLKGNSLSFV